MTTQPVLHEWATPDEGNSVAYDAWVANLMQAQDSSWDPAPYRHDAPFFAKIRHTALDRLSVIESHCSLCEGNRDASMISRDETELFAILMYQSGGENIRFGDERYELTAGDVFIWDSTRPTSFAVTSELRKTAVFMPLQTLRDWCPDDWRDMPRKLSGKNSKRLLLRALLSAISAPEFAETDVDSVSVSESIMSVIAGSDNEIASVGYESIRHAQKQRILTYIDKHLADPDLSVKKIAKENRISTRYLHWVFADEPCTVNKFVISQRLMKCRRDLVTKRNDRFNVSQIAHSWGFSNAAHFSSRYKAMFNESPSQTRARRR